MGTTQFGRIVELNQGVRDEEIDCPACGGSGTFGKARYWLRPPGFAHPVSIDVGTSADDQPVRSYATHAKLIVPTPNEENLWTKINDRIKTHHMRQHLLVTNRGPRKEGYSYCTKCGLIEPTVATNGITNVAHQKPYPDDQDQSCDGGGATRGMVLGTDFITEVLLISLKVANPITLNPGLLATDVSLRTLSEALAKATCFELQLDPGEIQAEYRPALTPSGRLGEEVEIY